jgi:hypothetical protein
LSGGSMDKTIITFQVNLDELITLDKNTEIFAYKNNSTRPNRSDYLRHLILSDQINKFAKEQSDDQRKKY